MSDRYILVLCALIAILGIGSIYGVMRFGRYMIDRSLDKFFPHPHFVKNLLLVSWLRQRKCLSDNR